MQAEAKQKKGVKMSEIERAHMIIVAPKILQVPEPKVSSWPTEKIVQELQNFFLKTKPPLSTCDRCGGESDSRLSACPYCGDVDEPPPESEDESESIDEEDASGEEETAVAKPRAISPQEKPKPKKKVRVLKTTSTSLAKVEPQQKMIQAVLTDKDLDKAIAEVHRLKAAVATNFWDLGHHIKTTFFEQELWKLCKDEGGLLKYKSFEQFLINELNLKAHYVYRAMEISTCFTQEDARTLGRSHLKVLVTAPKEDRAELLQLVKETGITYRPLYDKIKKLRLEKGIVRQSVHTRGKKGSKKTVGPVVDPERAKKKLEKMEMSASSIALIASKKKQTLKVLTKDGDKQAKSMKDSPQFSLKGSNGVVLYVNLREADNGGWEAQVVLKREEE